MNSSSCAANGIRTLSIGNSFSEDACFYIHKQAESMGIDFDTVNLYIGGCSLERHWLNWQSGEAEYREEKNGQPTGRTVSIRDALTDGAYDVVTLQQASHFSGKRETYFPYLQNLANIVREYQPRARVMIHQTWAYEVDSTHGAFPDYQCSQQLMYEKLCACYREAAKVIDAPQIPVGDAVQYFRENVPEFQYKRSASEENSPAMSLNRDGFHLSIPCGRYLAGLIWIARITEVLFGEAADITRCTFIPPFDENASFDCAIFDKIKQNAASFFKTRQEDRP